MARKQDKKKVLVLGLVAIYFVFRKQINAMLGISQSNEITDSYGNSYSAPSITDGVTSNDGETVSSPPTDSDGNYVSEANLDTIGSFSITEYDNEWVFQKGENKFYLIDAELSHVPLKEVWDKNYRNWKKDTIGYHLGNYTKFQQHISTLVVGNVDNDFQTINLG